MKAQIVKRNKENIPIGEIINVEDALDKDFIGFWFNRGKEIPVTIRMDVCEIIPEEK